MDNVMHGICRSQLKYVLLPEKWLLRAKEKTITARMLTDFDFAVGKIDVAGNICLSDLTWGFIPASPFSLSLTCLYIHK